MLCPRCQKPQEDGLEECLHCGVVFSRYRPRPVREEREPSWLAGRMFSVAPSPDRGPVAVRGVFLALLALAAVVLLANPLDSRSLLHWIDLPFHEAGHVVFSPLGTFLHILGGTLGQLLVPLVVIAAFLREENPFAASVGGWWLGQSLMDCAPYIADARVRQLLLTTGETGRTDWEGHDWFQILTRTGLLAHDVRIAWLFWTVGAGVVLASLLWGGYVLRKQWGPN
ncbi:hypothetical protein [Mesoterricola silvestris]|uniref:Uncharacterized protein n=1 Tax=Mesoterricola silvestris TaxID=2927979 RepID=A0AA48KC19_9BACT|nr:hypothetical protein [Mesoterricola silvestris]BDU73043.1 hypothetical protein METEAL_22170 [Mesoterricola silvestris]